MSWPKSVGSGIDGVVGLSEVVEVLRRHGVAVYPQEPGSSELVLKKGDLMEVHEFPPSVNRRILHYLKRKFDIPIHHFFHPHEAPLLPGEKVQ